jgi:hypothetical protein
MCSCHQLKFRLYRTRPSHGDEFAATDLQMLHRYHCLLVPRALQRIGGFGEPFSPTFTHGMALQSEEIKAYTLVGVYCIHLKVEERKRAISVFY